MKSLLSHLNLTIRCTDVLFHRHINIIFCLPVSMHDVALQIWFTSLKQWNLDKKAKPVISLWRQPPSCCHVQAVQWSGRWSLRYCYAIIWWIRDGLWIILYLSLMSSHLVTLLLLIYSFIFILALFIILLLVISKGYECKQLLCNWLQIITWLINSMLCNWTTPRESGVYALYYTLYM